MASRAVPQPTDSAPAAGTAQHPAQQQPLAPPLQSQPEIEPAEGALQQQQRKGGAGPDVATTAGSGVFGWFRTAVKDVQEVATGLSESFAKTLEEVAAAESDPEEEGQQPVRRGSAAPPPGADAPLPAEAEARRAEVLARLEGRDSRADALAAEAGRALSTVWGWGKQLAHKAAKEIAGTPLEEKGGEAAAAGGAEAAGGSGSGAAAGGRGFALGATLGSLGRTAQQVGDRLGRQAQQMLEQGLAGGGGGNGPASASALLLGEQDGDEVLAFEELFYVYGGRSELEGLERMSSECAR